MKRQSIVAARLLWILPLLITLSGVGHVTAQTSCVTPPSGLVSWWPGDGNAVDIEDGNADERSWGYDMRGIVAR